MDATTIMVYGHYQARMLWKNRIIKLLSDYFILAERRFKSSLKRFKANQSLHRKYSESMCLMWIEA